jgi:hypothetical protein
MSSVSRATPTARKPNVAAHHCVERGTTLTQLAAIAQLGVEMVKADLDDPASYTPALEGLHGAYVNADCSCLQLAPFTPANNNDSLGPLLRKWHEGRRGWRVRGRPVQGRDQGVCRRGCEAYRLLHARRRCSAAHELQAARSVLTCSLASAYTH